MVNFLSGIELLHLIVQLTSGQRLSCPKHCPEPISRLITDCFKKNPCDRPGFVEIIEKLQFAYDEMIENSRSKSLFIESEEQQFYMIPIHKVGNNEMKNQYTEMIKGNEYQCQNSIKKREKTKMLENGSIHYASLEMIKSPESDQDIVSTTKETVS